MSPLYSYISISIACIYFIIAVLYILFFFQGKKNFHKTAFMLILLNVALHIIFLIYFGIAENRFPLITVFEAMSVLALLLTFVYLVMEIRTGGKAIGAFIFPLIFVFQVCSAHGLKVVEVDEKIFHTPLFGIHTLAAMIGYSAMVISMILGVMYLHLFREIKYKKLMFMYDRLPPLETLDKMNITCIIVGFIFLSIGIASGGVWARSVWKKLSILDPKIFLSWVLWLIYLTGIVLRKKFGWGGRKIAYVSTLGFILMIFTFIFVNFVFPTKHKF